MLEMKLTDDMEDNAASGRFLSLEPHQYSRACRQYGAIAKLAMFCPSAQRQHRKGFPVALTNKKRLKLRTMRGLMIQCIPFHKLQTFRTNHDHFGTTWESSLWLPEWTKLRSPKNSVPSLDDDGNKTPSQEEETSTFNVLLAAGDGSGALEDVGKEIPYSERRDTL